MKALFIGLLICGVAFGRARTSGYCEQGGQVTVTGGVSSVTKVQQSYPQCTINVYYTGGARGIVSTNGTAVNLVSGIPFNANSGWTGLSVTINGFSYPISTVNSTTSITLTTPAVPSVQSSVTYSMPPTAPAPLFSDNAGTTKANPFTASTTGYWFYYANDGTYDVKMSGGGIPVPFTWGAISTIDPVATAYQLPAPGSIPTTIQNKLNSFYEGVADFGADNTNISDSTAAIQAAVTAGAAARICPHFIGGTYRLTYASVASIQLPSNGCIKGDGQNSTVFLQGTNSGVSFGIVGSNTQIRDVFIGKESGATGGTGISINPDVTSTVSTSFAVIDHVSVYSAYCVIGDASCETPANSNRLAYGILIQSGAKDSIFHWITNTKVRWATNGIQSISGGLAGSAGPGAAQASWFSNDWISNTTNCLVFQSSGENKFPGLQCTDASNAAVVFKPNTGGTYNGFQSSNNMGDVFGEANAAFVDFGNASSYTSSQCSQSNVIEIPLGEISSGLSGNIGIRGACQFENSVSAPGIFKTGFYYNAGTPTNSVDPFVCAGMIDDYSTQCTATIDFRSTANVQNVFRMRNGQNTSTLSDYVNWNPFTGGYVWRVATTYDVTAPMLTINHPGAAANDEQSILLTSGSGGSTVLKGGVLSRYYNSAVSGVTDTCLYAYDGVPAQNKTWCTRGDGILGPTIEVHVSDLTAFRGCNSTPAPLGQSNQVIAVSDLLAPTLGSAPVGGGTVHGWVHCNGVGYTVMAL